MVQYGTFNSTPSSDTNILAKIFCCNCLRYSQNSIHLNYCWICESDLCKDCITTEGSYVCAGCRADRDVSLGVGAYVDGENRIIRFADNGL